MNKVIKCNSLNLKIYVEDTDFQGVVYHANYIKFFERARSEFLAVNNISQNELRKDNLAFVIKSVNINYIAAAELGDEIEVRSEVKKESDARMIFNHQILNVKTGIIYVDGYVEVCFINLLTKKPKKFPDDLLLIFK
tara:strand:- start:134 stop:544 length:411 start_codon:yes stop_codon:yes gene_type:complete